MYTKKELIYQIMTEINGGRNTQDTTVRPEDIGKYLPAAVNYAIIQQYRINKSEEGSSLPGEFIATYEDVEVKENTKRGLKYIDLPARTIPLPKDMGVNMISPMKGSPSQGISTFIRTTTTQLSHLQYVIKHTPDQTYYWIEGSKVYFDNLGELVDEVLVRMVASVDDIGDDVQLPIPAGLEVDVIRIVTEFFTGQRQMPAGMINSNKDEAVQ